MSQHKQSDDAEFVRIDGERHRIDTDQTRWGTKYLTVTNTVHNTLAECQIDGKTALIDDTFDDKMKRALDKAGYNLKKD